MASIAAERLAVPSPVVITPPSPGWMSNPWVIRTSHHSGVEYQDTLRLRANGTIEIQKSNSTQSTPWATSCTLTCAGLSGVTVDGRHFLIQFNSASGQLTCTFGPASSQGIHSLGDRGPNDTWVAQEGGPSTVEPPPPGSQDSGPSHG